MSCVKFEPKKVAMRLLLTLLKNVVDDPDNDKYRTLKLDNAKLSTNVFEVDGCSQFLEECGFQPMLDTRALNITYDAACGEGLKAKLSELENFVQKQMNEQWRRERDAKIDRERTIDAAKTWRKRKASALNQAETITLQLQTLTQCVITIVDANSTIEHLREVAAKKYQRSALQINMSLCKDNESKKLISDEVRLLDVGVVEGSTIMLTFGMEDEILTEVAAAKGKVTDLRNNTFYADADKRAQDCSWQFTQELMKAAEERELMDSTRLQMLRRRMYVRDLTMKQVRDEVLAWAEEGSLDDIKTKFLDKGSDIRQSVTRAVEQAEIQEDKRQWAMMIADHNRQGLLRECQRPFSNTTASVK